LCEYLFFSYRNLEEKRLKKRRIADKKRRASKVGGISKNRCDSVSLSEGDLADLKIAKDDGMDAASETSDFNRGALFNFNGF
jgi:hypothetical protein